jgi:hypothetical protein
VRSYARTQLFGRCFREVDLKESFSLRVVEVYVRIVVCAPGLVGITSPAPPRMSTRTAT